MIDPNDPGRDRPVRLPLVGGVLIALILGLAIGVVALTRGTNATPPVAATPASLEPGPTETPVPTPTPEPTATATPASVIPFADCTKVSFGSALGPSNPPSDLHKYPAEPPRTIDASKLYLVTMETTKGRIVLCIQPDLAPRTANVFVTLVRNHFYDGLTFHRVGPSDTAPAVIQGGDPAGDGSGGPGFQFGDEPIRQHFVPGTICMANSGVGTGTNGSQFFINKDTETSLEPQGGGAYSYNLFGRVVTGLDVVQKIVVGDKMTSVSVSEQR